MAQVRDGPRHHTRFPWGVVIRSALNITATVMDVEGTQRCLHHGTCIEGNPAMPTNPRVVWPLEGTLTGASVFMDYRSWEEGRRYGWIAPIVSITEHTVGAATGWTK